MNGQSLPRLASADLSSTMLLVEKANGHVVRSWELDLSRAAEIKMRVPAGLGVVVVLGTS